MIDRSHTNPGGFQVPFSLLQGVNIIADFERDMLQSNRLFVRSHSILTNRSDGEIMVIAEAKKCHLVFIEPCNNWQTKNFIIKRFRPRTIANIQHDMTKRLNFHRIVLPQ
jgi:hypothetical protein